MIDIEELITNVMDYAMNVRKQLVPGYEEKVYRNALLIEIRKHGIECEAEVPFSVLYDGISVGDYKADIIVEKRLVLELKAVEALQKVHEVQLVNYLTATGIDDGLLINFGSQKIEFKRKFRIYRPQY
jgi:GxxExxY protein